MPHAAETARGRIRFAGQRGFTLIESLVAIIVVAIALTGVLLVLNLNIAHSADPMIRTQAYDIAAAYLDEIMPKDYGATCPEKSGGRQNWEHVSCYDGLTDDGARDQFDQAVPGLGAYTVSVSVTPATAATLCDSGNAHCPPAELVTVTVTHAPQVGVHLSAYRLQQ